ncbi:hypothetical protein [Streptomyces violaceusniger]|uniref:Uncharacterized protein n=1 Tax=Streptomyces violaceusniger (strain Tu 4113) TaxID=653045 RepID=G2PF42_STRV4|nr:hypothetical protein [Streptomyces violaceusniger]AEM84048.1 hypothetical protein Strvi_4409 [Streptomyces violaceusniger Tu 4113]
MHPAVADQIDAFKGIPFLLQGSVDQVAEQILYWHEERGMSYFVLGNDADATAMFR